MVVDNIFFMTKTATLQRCTRRGAFGSLDREGVSECVLVPICDKCANALIILGSAGNLEAPV